jgi:hypothetical protein
MYRVLGRICGCIGYLGEYVDVYGTWENVWMYRVLGRICRCIGCLGEYVDV